MENLELLCPTCHREEHHHRKMLKKLGQVAERPIALAWKAGDPQGSEGSNPSLSAK